MTTCEKAKGYFVTKNLSVKSGEAEFYVQVEEVSGPQTVSLADSFSLDEVQATVGAIATDLSRAWEKAKPSEATVEFGLKLIAKSGKLTGLLVDGAGEASLNIKLTWKTREQE
jgi:hypothetical protein